MFLLIIELVKKKKTCTITKTLYNVSIIIIVNIILDSTIGNKNTAPMCCLIFCMVLIIIVL